MNKKKVRLAILKELDKGNKCFTHEDFTLSFDEFEESVEWLKNEGLIRNADYDMSREYDFESTQVTGKGEKYLHDNSAIIKTYRGLKEIRDWIKL